MACTNCHRDLPIAARGYCRACYSRWQKYGSPEKRPRRRRNFCHIDNCGKPVVSNGLCDMHRNRLRRHGTVEQTRPDSWGAKHKHPLFNSWAWMRRHRGAHEIHEPWATDFLQFAMDVGERPSPKHKLVPADANKPLGPQNFMWREPLTKREPGEPLKVYMNRVQKVYRGVRRERFADYERKKHFGMAPGEYARLSEKQDHKCAICGEPEKLSIRGKTVSLAVDHCHTNGRVRGLLCSRCNTAIGLLRNSPAIMDRAAEYLRFPTTLV